VRRAAASARVAGVALGRARHGHWRLARKRGLQERRQLDRAKGVIVVVELQPDALRVDKARGDEARALLTCDRELHDALHLGELDRDGEAERERAVAHKRLRGVGTAGAEGGCEECPGESPH